MSTSPSAAVGAAAKPELGILFTWNDRYGYKHLTGHMVQFSAGYYSDDQEVKWRRVLTDSRNGEPAPYVDLEHYVVEISLYEDTFGGERSRHTYRTAQFEAISRINSIPAAKGILKVLERVDRYTDRVNAEDGYPTSDGQWVVRIARALGAKWIIMDSSLCGEYSQPQRQLAVNADGMNAVDHIVKHFIESGTNVWAERRTRQVA